MLVVVGKWDLRVQDELKILITGRSWQLRNRFGQIDVHWTESSSMEENNAIYLNLTDKSFGCIRAIY